MKTSKVARAFGMTVDQFAKRIGYTRQALYEGIRMTTRFVNYLNKWFSVEYDCGGVKQRTSFKFSQVGEDVLICGH